MALNLDAAHNQEMRLIERESQLAALHQYAREASQGQGRLVLISGEAGVGKSVLVEEFAEELNGARWLWAGCDGLFTPAALGPLLDIANQIEGELLRLCHAEAKRDQLYGALLRQLGDLHTPTVITIEDVHWADEATLDLLSYLGRRIQHLRVLLLVSYREEDLVANDPLRLTLGGLASQRATRRLTVPTLSTAGVATLAEGTRIDATELHRLTAGNPFFVTEVLQGGSHTLPASVRDAVLSRTRTLSTPARAALDVAALIGSRMQSGLLVSLVEDPLVVDELISHGLLIKDGDDLRFRHEIARVAIEAAVPPYRQAAIHTNILDALISSGSDDDARLAFHAEGAGSAELVLRYAPRAGRRAAALAARREAAAQYERALRFVPETDIRSRAELLDSLGQQLDFVDRQEDLLETCSAAVALWHELGDSERESDSLLSLGGSLWWLCRGADSWMASKAQLKLAEPLGPSPQLAKAYNNLAGRRLTRGRYEESLTLIRQVREMSEELGLGGDVISQSLNIEAQLGYAMGDDWTLPMGAALETALSGGYEYQVGNLFATMYWMYCGELRYEEGEQIYEQAMAYCDLHDIGTSVNCLLAERAGVFEKLGRWDECVSIAHTMLEELSVSPANRIQPLCYQAKVMARRGQEFWSHLDEAMHLAIGLDEPEWLSFVGLARVEAHWLEGRLDAARAELDRVRDASAGIVVLSRPWIALWTWRLTGATAVIDLEPFASQIDGDGAHAAELWDRLGCRYEAALALLDTKDEVLLRESLARLSDLGAEAAARVVRRTMRDLGIRSIPAGARTTTRAHPQGLTTREQEILQLLSEGQSNEEISARLFISVRTVEHHVSAILGKLGATTRKGAASEALKLGLTHADRVSA